jgi:hypothetical protein
MRSAKVRDRHSPEPMPQRGERTARAADRRSARTVQLEAMTEHVLPARARVAEQLLAVRFIELGCQIDHGLALLWVRCHT